MAGVHAYADSLWCESSLVTFSALFWKIVVQWHIRWSITNNYQPISWGWFAYSWIFTVVSSNSLPKWMHCKNLSEECVNNARLPSVHTSVWWTSSELRRSVIVASSAMQQRHWTIHKPVYSTVLTSLCNKIHLQLHASSGLTKQLLVVVMQALEAIEAESSDKIITLKSKWLTLLRRLGDFDSIFTFGVVLRLFELTYRLSWHAGELYKRVSNAKSFFAAKYSEVVDMAYGAWTTERALM